MAFASIRELCQATVCKYPPPKTFEMFPDGLPDGPFSS